MYYYSLYMTQLTFESPTHTNSRIDTKDSCVKLVVMGLCQYELRPPVPSQCIRLVHRLLEYPVDI